MDVRITTRRVEVTQAFRLRADERLRKLARYEPRLLAAELILEEDAGICAAELRTSVAGVPPVLATAKGDSPRTALDRVLDRVRRQLRRGRTRRTDHQAPSTGALAAE